MANLERWKEKLRDMMDNPWDGDSDHPDCPECGCTMNFYGHDDEGDFEIGAGYWECSDCGFTFSESDLY